MSPYSNSAKYRCATNLFRVGLSTMLKILVGKRGRSDPMVGQKRKSLFLKTLWQVDIGRHLRAFPILSHPLQSDLVPCCLFWTQIGHARIPIDEAIRVNC